MRNTPMFALCESVRKASAEMLEARIHFTEFAVLRQRFNAIPGDDLVIIENEGPSTTGPTTIVVPHQGRLLNDADVPDTVYSIPHALNVQAGDLNGDGIADLIVTRDASTGQASGQRQISVLLNDGNGNFANGPGQPLYNNDRATGDIVATGDVNGDGATDLVVTTAGSPNTFHVLFGGKKGNGGGGGGGSGGVIGANFTLPQGALIVALADLDGDGKLDCVFSVSPPGSTGISLAGVALGDGNGGFATAPALQTPTKDVSQVLVGTFEPGSTTTQIGLVTRTVDGGGINLPQVNVTTTKGGAMVALPAIQLPGDFPMTGISLGRVNGDAFDHPMAVSSDASTARVLTVSTAQGVVQYRETDFQFANAKLQDPGLQMLTVDTGDLDGDGIPDLIVTTANPLSDNNAIHWADNPLYQPGGGDSQLHAIWSTGLAAIPEPVLTQETVLTRNFVINRTQSMDAEPDEFVAMLNTGDLTTGPTLVDLFAATTREGPPQLRASFAVPHVLEAFAADFNGDGLSDLLLVSRDQASGQASGKLAFTILISDGKGAFLQGKAWMGPACDAVDGVADVNGDGAADVVVHAVGQNGNTFTTLFSNRDGSFTPSAARVLPTGDKLVGLPDLDGDGKADFVFEIQTPKDAASGQASGIMVNLGDGSGDVQGSISHTYHVANMTQVLFGDFNGDGALDIMAVTLSGATGQTDMRYTLFIDDGTPIRRVVGPRDLPTGMPTGRIIAADLNGDGFTDLVFTGGHSIVPAIAIGDPGVNGNFAPGIAIDEPGVHITSVAVGDVNGDGVPDILYMADGFLTIDLGVVTKTGTYTMYSIQKGARTRMP